MSTINLSSFVKTAATSTSSATGRNDSAYTMMGGEGIAVTTFLQYKKVAVVKGDKCLYMSTSNIKSVPVEILERVTNGEKADFGVHKSEHPSIQTIFNLFYSENGPKTKCHDHGWFLKPSGDYCFFALQGTSIKEVIL